MGLGGAEMSQTSRSGYRRALYRDFSFRCSSYPDTADLPRSHWSEPIDVPPIPDDLSEGTMRKIVLFMSVSVDGFFEGPDHDISWHAVDNELHTYFNDHLRTMGAFLDGRVTYELMADFWPTADADPGASGPMAEFAGIWREMPKIVFSRTLQRAGWNTRIVREVDVSEIMALKAQAGGDLALGGADLAATFLAHDLIDEFWLFIHPVLLGQGKPLFRTSDVTTVLHLTETRAFGNGVVLLRYARVGASAAG
jgi:dihydrofolate reductase